MLLPRQRPTICQTIPLKEVSRKLPVMQMQSIMNRLHMKAMDQTVQPSSLMLWPITRTVPLPMCAALSPRARAVLEPRAVYLTCLIKRDRSSLTRKSVIWMQMIWWWWHWMQVQRISQRKKIPSSCWQIRMIFLLSVKHWSRRRSLWPMHRWPWSRRPM